VERTVQEACRAAVEAGLVASAHDLSEGGLAVALVECCVSGPGTLGAAVELGAGRLAPEAALFGEGPSRVLVSVPPAHERHFEQLMREFPVPWRWVGRVGGDRLEVRLGTPGGRVGVSVAVDAVGREWRDGFARDFA
jgi:phosphoribosylformylglycinamidine synthase